MTSIRVLLVDDSVVVRRVLTDVLSSDPAIEVVGAAPNGKVGVQKVAQLEPDLVVLDIEMPEMDGITTLREIRKQWRRLPVIMFSTLTARGASATLEALAAGASDYATKPTNTSGIADAADSLRAELIPKIKALAPKGVHHHGLMPAPPSRPMPPGRAEPRPRPGARALPEPPARPERPRRRSDFSGRPEPRPETTRHEPMRIDHGPAVLRKRQGPVPRVDIVAIGVSTGGPNALAEVIPALPANLGVPVVIVQHMPATFTKLLAERLDRSSPLHIVEGTHGMPMRPNEVYIAPGDFHMTVRREGLTAFLELNQGPPENSCRPAVDVLFRSVDTAYGANTLAVIMTGMGSDGTKSCETLAQHNAQVIVQDEATSVVWGMPGFVARAGLAEAIVPLGDLAGEITKRTLRPGVAAMAAAAGGRG
ncbi:MAG: chemotaxis response regulator protein-glutamate methylesterase [Acidimicrobiia bacterium]